MDPDRYSTLIEMLADRSERNADRTAFTFQDQPVTFGEMWARINRFAQHLLDLGIAPGERVLMALPNGPEFFSGFYGVQRAGGIAVPVFPGAGADRVFAIAKLCGADKVIVPSAISGEQLASIRGQAADHSLSILLLSEYKDADADGPFPEVQPDQVAFLQYTSGSTGNPKGVMITQANLMTNIRQMIEGMEIVPEDIFVSWLPVYHDMGLILKTMVPFCLGAALYLLPTDLRDVRPWLDEIHRRRATFTAAPDFAYRLALRKVDPQEYDLSSLRVALNAAEPVRKSTISAFHQSFGLENVMVAGYGLAEVTVGVSMWPPGTPNRVDPQGVVSVGPPFPGVEVAIVTDGRKQPAGKVGEIAIRSTANSAGYFNNPEENRRLVWQDGHYLSGDLGYLDEDGNLYIVSRKKNIIKRSGETISPWEIEEVVDRIPDVRYSAAVGVERGMEAGEQVIVFAEIRNGQKADRDSLHATAVRIAGDVHGYMGFRPARAYLLKPKGIPLTDNGKIQHVRLRELYLDGSLRAQGVILYPEF